MQYEINKGIGIYSLSGKLTSRHEDDLKIVLMRALYNTERAVINLKEVSNIDESCLDLLKNAYCTSLRLKNPVIMTGIAREYADRIFKCDEKSDGDMPVAAGRSLNCAGQNLNCA